MRAMQSLFILTSSAGGNANTHECPVKEHISIQRRRQTLSPSPSPSLPKPNRNNRPASSARPSYHRLVWRPTGPEGGCALLVGYNTCAGLYQSAIGNGLTLRTVHISTQLFDRAVLLAASGATIGSPVCVESTRTQRTVTSGGQIKFCTVLRMHRRYVITCGDLISRRRLDHDHWVGVVIQVLLLFVARRLCLPRERRMVAAKNIRKSLLRSLARDSEALDERLKGGAS